jgi:hypothetical protein
MCDGHALRPIDCCVALFVFGLFFSLSFVSSRIFLTTRATSQTTRRHHCGGTFTSTAPFLVVTSFLKLLYSLTRSTYPRGLIPRLENGRARAHHIVYTAYL